MSSDICICIRGFSPAKVDDILGGIITRKVLWAFLSLQLGTWRRSIPLTSPAAIYLGLGFSVGLG